MNKINYFSILGFTALYVVTVFAGSTSKKGALLAYPVLPVGVIGWILPLWTRTQWYHLWLYRHLACHHMDEGDSINISGISNKPSNRLIFATRLRYSCSTFAAEIKHK